MVEMIGKAKEIVKSRVNDVKEGVFDEVRAPIGGIIDTVRASADNLFVKPFAPDEKPIPGIAQSVGALITQPILRLGRAGKKLLTLHPLRAAAETGVAAIVDIPTQTVNLVQGIMKWVTDQVKVIFPGVGRALIGAATAEDIARDRFKTEPKTRHTTVNTSFGAKSPPEGPMTFFGGGAAPAGAH